MANTAIELIVRGILIHEGRVLVCRRLDHPHVFLPGGHVDFDEPASAALMREVHEELGVELSVGTFLGASEGRFRQARHHKPGTRLHHEINLYFMLRTPQPFPARLLQPVAAEDHLAFDWLNLADLDSTPAEPILLPPAAIRFVHAARNPIPAALGWQSDWV